MTFMAVVSINILQVLPDDFMDCLVKVMDIYTVQFAVLVKHVECYAQAALAFVMDCLQLPVFSAILADMLKRLFHGLCLGLNLVPDYRTKVVIKFVH